VFINATNADLNTISSKFFLHRYKLRTGVEYMAVMHNDKINEPNINIKV